MADADFAGERVEVQELSDTSGKQDEKPVEGGGVPNVRDEPDVSFEVGLQVVLVVDVRRDARCREFGHPASQDERVLGKRRRLQGFLEFRERERQKLQESAASGKRLGDGLSEKRLVGSGEDESAAFAPALVDERLDGRGELRAKNRR